MADVGQKKVVHRKGNFSIPEDELLCHVYLEISQDPIEGTNQKKDRVWERIIDLFNQGKDENQTRSSKSLQSRFSDLTLCVGKFRGAIRQLEHENPSGASEKDICARAKQYLLDDPTFTKKRLQFDHVWPILKDAEKWTDTGRSSTRPRQRNDSTDGYESTSRTSQSSGTLSFDVNLNAEEDEQELYNDELGTSRRPMGVKKAKLKRKEANEQSKIAKQLQESNQELKELFEKSLLERTAFASKHEQYASQKLSVQREREENKIMLTSLDSIPDSEGREYLRMRKAEIMERRAHQSRLQQSPAASGFGNFGNINQFQGGSQGSFNSGNFASPFQFPTGFGGYRNHHGGTTGYGGVPHYGGNDGSGTSDPEGGVQQFGNSNGSETHSGYGQMPEHGRSDDSLPEY